MGRPQGRPVLGSVVVAREALAGAAPERVWALSDAEVTEAMAVLGQLSASVDAHLVAVLAEAKRRELGSGQGLGPVGWARAQAPGWRPAGCWTWTPSPAAADELRLADVVEAVAEGAGPEQGEALPVEKAAQLVRFHQGGGAWRIRASWSGHGDPAARCARMRRVG